MRHLRQIGGDRVAEDVLAHRDRELPFALAEALRLEAFAQVDRVALGIRNLDADHRLAGERRNDADRDRAKRHGQVVGPAAGL